MASSPSDKFIITRGELMDLIAMQLLEDRSALVDQIISEHQKVDN